MVKKSNKKKMPKNSKQHFHSLQSDNALKSKVLNPDCNKLQRKKKFDKKELIPIFIIFIMFSIGIFLYDKMPEQMPTHWNFEGEIDGYGSKFTGLLLMPIITLGIYLLMSAIPYIAVYKKNIKAFYFYYFGFKIMFIVYMLILYILTLLPNFDIMINMNYVIMPLVAIILFFSGFLMEKSKRNYFIGIRTPWTLSSDKVWNETHKVGAKGFKLIAIIMFISAFIGKCAIIFSVAVLIGFVVVIFVYSYLLFKKEKLN
jgi:uncharacterized membrane protein